MTDRTSLAVARLTEGCVRSGVSYWYLGLSRHAVDQLTKAGKLRSFTIAPLIGSCR
jgi:hypothetical protein